MFTLGIDIGSTTSKCVILKDGTEIVATSLVKSGIGTNGPKIVVDEILAKANLKLKDIAHTTATGYGRNRSEIANSQMSELSCHTIGVHFVFPNVKTIIDIGGQDAKVMSVGADGIMQNFLMNDKCAAGTGRFLDVMANILQIDISELEVYAAKATNEVKISSTCTVFAESEVISQLTNGVELPDLVKGICESVAGRVSALAKRIGIKDDVVMSGGVAQNGGVRTALEKALGTKVYHSELSQYMGALGAAIFANKKANK